ncbi:sensor histidine kinase [Pedobacter petrophilus]|uniref:histidine kinase n=1 Tax=Pedobacter petrophilus TaxID=1908241 RepID=A0A7K0G355_9SPHI|nr:HAMP domain-containing sensor histidine kinase [Pedobacter petrophilus]MRX77830.1 sensor histidine kinase [Pedobacter petrophilus]
MKLSSKLIFFIAGSKLALGALFVAILPLVVNRIASDFTNFSLEGQRKKVMANIGKNGVETYLAGENSYGSYTMLKDEYIAIEKAPVSLHLDTIRTTKRIVETDTLSYRVLSATFGFKGRNYLLEIGKTTASINLYNDSLQKFAVYVLVLLIAISIFSDLIFTRRLIRPLGQIIKKRLVNSKFPFIENQTRVKTTTSDFNYLDESLISLMNQINEAFAKEREFTANASHEFLTPISILQNKMENLLVDESTSHQVQQSIVEMMKTLERLKKISRSLLLISRIDNAQFIKKERVEPAKIINEIIEEISHRMEENNINMEVKLSHSFAFDNLNHDLLFQLFYNIIHNAIKFNKKNGSIVISDTLKGKDYSILIEDTGMGMTEEETRQMFNRFNKSNSSANTGYGLGLAIVKSIAIYLDLKLQVQSKLTRGTTFEIQFKKIEGNFSGMSSGAKA